LSCFYEYGSQLEMHAAADHLLVLPVIVDYEV
jgi:hypothetical protein